MNVLILFVFIQRQVESFSQSILKIEWQRKKKLLTILVNYKFLKYSLQKKDLFHDATAEPSTHHCSMAPFTLV